MSLGAPNPIASASSMNFDNVDAPPAAFYSHDEGMGALEFFAQIDLANASSPVKIPWLLDLFRRAKL
jgi:hypothetical protein